MRIRDCDVGQKLPFYVLGRARGDGGRTANVTVYYAEAGHGSRVAPLFSSREKAEEFIQLAGLPDHVVELSGKLLLQTLQKLMLRGVSCVSYNPRPDRATLIEVFRLLVELEVLILADVAAC